MTLNLDVSVRLLDGLSTPAGKAEKSLDRFGAAATRLASRVRGLSGAMRALPAMMTALGRKQKDSFRMLRAKSG